MHDAYRCNCRRIWDSEDLAKDCSNCSPELVSVCDVCEQTYFDSDLAKECENSHD